MSKYLGIPQEEWDSLAAQAEDVMLAKGYGQHILGTYPAGPRIFGSTKVEPRLLVIIVDEPSRHFNPFTCDRAPVTEGPLYFMDLHEWVRSLECGVHDLDEPSCGFPHAIPILGPPHYEDPQLTEITHLAQTYLQARNWDCALDLPCIWTAAPYLRTRYILGATGQFIPCLNRNWDTVEPMPNLPEEHSQADDALVQCISSEQELSDNQKREISLYCSWLRKRLIKQRHWKEAKEEEQQLGEAVKRFYVQLM